MPIYAFSCSDCETKFETLVARPTAEPDVECPACGGMNLVREFSLPAKPAPSQTTPLTNCRGDGPPCGAEWCGRRP